MALQRASRIEQQDQQRHANCLRAAKGAKTLNVWQRSAAQEKNAQTSPDSILGDQADVGRMELGGDAAMLRDEYLRSTA